MVVSGRTVVYSCPPMACVGEQSLTGCFQDSNTGTGNTGIMCGACMHRGELDVDRQNTVKVRGRCYNRCKNDSYKVIEYWLQFVVQYTLLGLLLKFNGGMLDVHVDGATIGHLTFFFQTWQLLAKFGDADMYGISSLLRHLRHGSGSHSDMARGLRPMSTVGNMSAASLLNSEDDSECDWELGMYGSFYTMVAAVPLFMWSFSLMLWFLDSRHKEKSALAAIHRIWNDEAAPKASKKNCLMKIGPIEKKLTESSGASRLDIFANPTRMMGSSGKDGNFHPEGLWWLMASLKLQHGLRAITLNRTIIEICMFCYMKVAMACFPMLLCRGVTSVIDGERVVQSLAVSDLGVECTGALFWITRILALCLFVGFVIGFPVFLIRSTKIEDVPDSDDPSSEARQHKIPPKFDPLCRVSNIFDAEHRYW